MSNLRVAKHTDPRLASGGRGNMCPDGPDGPGRLFPIPILEVRASIPSRSEALAVQLHALHSHFLLENRKNRGRAQGYARVVVSDTSVKDW